MDFFTIVSRSDPGPPAPTCPSLAEKVSDASRKRHEIPTNVGSIGAFSSVPRQTDIISNLTVAWTKGGMGRDGGIQGE